MGPEQLALMMREVRLYASEDRPTMKTIHENVARAFGACNEDRVARGLHPYPVPSYETVRRAIHMLDPFCGQPDTGKALSGPRHGCQPESCHRPKKRPAFWRAFQVRGCPFRGAAYLMIFDTTPAPTVRPPSRIAKRSFSSIAIGAISSTSNFRLSPGITISVPSGSFTVPVTSVVRK